MRCLSIASLAIGVVLLVTIFVIMARGQEVSLDSPLSVDTPVAAKIRWATQEPIRINTDAQKLTIYYEYVDTAGTPIRDDRFKSVHMWTCSDIPTANTGCLGVGDPHAWCTGAGTGTFDDNCFSDVFGFAIRQQDVGKKIGYGLRRLILNKFCQDVAPGKACDFADQQ